MHAMIINPTTGELRSVKVGFSWTTFFWGFWPALFRKDFKWALISLIASAFSFSAFSLVWAFLYNKTYITDRLEDGWMPNSDADIAILKSKGIFVEQSYENYQRSFV